MDAYQKTGCINLICSGFVQINPRYELGAPIQPTSQERGKRTIWGPNPDLPRNENMNLSLSLSLSQASCTILYPRRYSCSKYLHLLAISGYSLLLRGCYPLIKIFICTPHTFLQKNGKKEVKKNNNIYKYTN